MSDDPCFLSAGELRRQIGAKEISPLEITRAVLARVERLQPLLNCFIEICADRALVEAKDAERRIMAGDPLRGLEGIAFTVKDIVNTRDVRTTFGAIPYRDNVPDHDAVAVARLRAAGAILIGKTTTPEFGTKCLTDSPLFGRTRNAWSGERSSGGSSGGAAGGVAGGVGPAWGGAVGGGPTRLPGAPHRRGGLEPSTGVVPQQAVAVGPGNSQLF